MLIEIKSITPSNMFQFSSDLNFISDCLQKVCRLLLSIETNMKDTYTKTRRETRISPGNMMFFWGKFEWVKKFFLGGQKFVP